MQAASSHAMTSWLRYVGRRLGWAALLVFLVSSAALGLARLAPGDVTDELVAAGVRPEVIAAERERLGLDRSFAAQYTDWLARAARLDFGVSLRYGRPVGALVGERARNTALLAVTALLLATLAGVPLGLVAGSRRGAPAAIIRAGSVLALSLPPLITSLLLVLLAARTGWLPVGGMTSPAGAEGWLAQAADVGRHLMIPAIALALPVAATLERLQAGAVAAVLDEPWIRAARARGLSASRLLYRHVLKVSLKPVASTYGIIVGGLLSGSFIVELVTAWPGLGRLMYEALLARDLYLVAGCAAAGSAFLALGTLLSDLALAAVDPRLREAP